MRVICFNVFYIYGKKNFFFISLHIIQRQQHYLEKLQKVKHLAIFQDILVSICAAIYIN